MAALVMMAVLLAAPRAGAETPAPHEVAAAVMPSVMLIVALDKNEEPIGFGSGFVIKEGVVVTNAHVIEGARFAVIKPVGDEATYTANYVLARDKDLDLAVLPADGLDKPALPLGDSNAVNIGEVVYAVGNPEGLEGTFSVGNVSAFRKEEGVNFIQVTAPISPGSSGGPVLNAQGEVVGIATATILEGQNLNFAVPVSDLKGLLERKNISLAGVKEVAVVEEQPDTPDTPAEVQPQPDKAWSGDSLEQWFDKPGTMLVADSSSKTYYWLWCPGHQDIAEANKVWFETRAQAEAEGYRRAEGCRGYRDR